MRLSGKAWKICKLFLYSILGLIAVYLVFIVLFYGLVWLSGDGNVTETCELGDYGAYTGNFDKEFPGEFINSFFPEQIGGNFSNVTYHYKVRKGDSYAFEAWLDFTIEDPEEFRAFIEETTQKRFLDRQTTLQPFAYDEAYMDYTVSCYLELSTDEAREAGYPIGDALIGKVLYCEETRHIIFVAIAVHDGYSATTTDLNHFFEYFHIDPVEFEQNASTPNW